MAKPRRPSTVVLLALAAAMLAGGFLGGMLLSQQGCQRRSTPERTEKAPAKQAPKRPVPVYEEPAPHEPEHREPVPRRRAGKPAEGLPRVALVIDDLGYAPPELVIRLCAQPVPFTVAVLPYQEHTKESATLAHDRGKEVILHLPMEGSPGSNPGPDALLESHDAARIRSLVEKALADVPFRAGANNHMGSKLTADRARMRWVLEAFKGRKLFFLDSRTSKETVAFEVARELGIPSAQRQVFLDDDKAFPEIEKQWERALAIAKRDGEAIVIGHIYPETVEALEKLLPRSKGEVQFVKVGSLVK